MSDATPGPPAQHGSVIAITGAAGFIGSHLCEHFRRRGWEVRALVRDPTDQAIRATGVHPYRLELPETIPVEALRGAKAVVHCAYMTRFTNLAEARRVNDEGTRRLIALGREAGVGRFVFASTQSAHENAVSYYGRSKLALERLFSPDTDLCLSLGLVIGRRGAGLFHRMVDTVRRSRVLPLFGGGRQPLQTVHVDDLCAAVESALHREVVGRLTVASPAVTTLRSFLESIARRLGKRPVFVPFPIPPALAALRLIELLHIPFPVSSENLLGLKCLEATDTTRDLETLGVRLRATDESLDDALYESPDLQDGR